VTSLTNKQPVKSLQIQCHGRAVPPRLQAELLNLAEKPSLSEASGLLPKLKQLPVSEPSILYVEVNLLSTFNYYTNIYNINSE
jgi:hypothetical protein